MALVLEFLSLLIVFPTFAALVTDVTSARLCRQHNDANVLALGERLTGVATAMECVDTFLSTDFEGAGISVVLIN